MSPIADRELSAQVKGVGKASRPVHRLSPDLMQQVRDLTDPFYLRTHPDHRNQAKPLPSVVNSSPTPLYWPETSHPKYAQSDGLGLDIAIMHRAPTSGPIIRNFFQVLKYFGRCAYIGRSFVSSILRTLPTPEESSR